MCRGVSGYFHPSTWREGSSCDLSLPFPDSALHIDMGRHPRSGLAQDCSATYPSRCALHASTLEPYRADLNRRPVGSYTMEPRSAQISSLSHPSRGEDKYTQHPTSGLVLSSCPPIRLQFLSPSPPHSPLLLSFLPSQIDFSGEVGTSRARRLLARFSYVVEPATASFPVSTRPIPIHLHLHQRSRPPFLSSRNILHLEPNP